MRNLEHRFDCQLLTVPNFGLCTCDFDHRMTNRRRADHPYNGPMGIFEGYGEYGFGEDEPFIPNCAHCHQRPDLCQCQGY